MFIIQKQLAMFTTLMLSVLLAVGQPGPETANQARVGQIDGKPVFIGCTPSNECYSVAAFKIRRNRHAPDQMASRALKKANKMTKDFDALIVESSSNYGRAVKFNAGGASNDVAAAHETKDKLTFVRSEPLTPYTVVGEYTYKRAPGELLVSYPSRAVRRAYDLGYTFDGIIINGKGKAKAIKFNQ